MAALRALDYHGAGYREDCSRYVGCHIAGKEEEGICNIFGLCHSAKRNILDDRLDKGIGKNSDFVNLGLFKNPLDPVNPYVYVLERR